MIYRVSAHFKELFKMKILVIVDMQNDFINGALGTPEAQAAVGDVADRGLTLIRNRASIRSFSTMPRPKNW